MCGMNSESVDLIYLDPPFKKLRNQKGEMKTKILDWLLEYLDECYNVESQDYDIDFAKKAEAYLYDMEVSFNQTTNDVKVIIQFDEIWEFDKEKEEQLRYLREANRNMYNVIQAVPNLRTKAYMVFMGVRIIEMHRILARSGSIFLHCDQDANSYIRILLDTVFGEHNHRNEIVWFYPSNSNATKYFPRKSDTIYFYSKSANYTFNADDVREPYSQKTLNRHKTKVKYHHGKGYEAKLNPKGRLPFNVWQIPALRTEKERIGYPTQKPLMLIDRIIKTCSNEDDRFFDPFAGCATSAHSAYLNNRKWMICDSSFMSVILLRLRLWLIQSGRWPGEQGDMLLKYPYQQTKQKTKQPVLFSPRIETCLTASERYKTKMRLFGEQKGKCTGCGQNKQYPEFELDHVLPKALDGPDVEDNIQLLCRSCNGKKGKKHESDCKDWMYKFTGNIYYH